ncbi:DUF6438 domain-containing protein [Sphingomonas sp. TDK1]|uniref:DUF6438 domain-containing protein n=1 Tax=Sphingomonas sp. TDK1 TaxID=453247 RepID=UPI0007D95069|nr:DUF6438 domain-containing protein [Sphingomonas sp. TDK1]OAN66913.1 hypothetical protein A7X12_09850 [Sphingomonas sp. TDK1]
MRVLVALVFGGAMLGGCIPQVAPPQGPARPAPAGPMRPTPPPPPVSSGTPAGPSAPIVRGEMIRYTTTPCGGACPVYSVTVRPDGTGTFEGQRFTAVSGARDFRVSPGQYESFLTRLAPYRPRSGSVRIAPGTPSCGQHATDMPSVEVQWDGKAGHRALSYYFGCERARNASMADAIGSAPDLLPIASLIGARP